MLAQRLSFLITIPNEVTLLAHLFHAKGHQLYLVGGAVRDALMKKVPKDFDVATDATPDRVIEIVSSMVGVKILDIGKAFGVIKVVFPSLLEIEIATFRTDVGMGRRPEAVVFSTIEEDVQRRDLTINALFYDILQQQVVDYVGGISDIENHVIRAVGDPIERFKEDRLRIMRAVRFAAQFGSELHRDTEEAIRKDPSLDGVSSERIRDEFLKSINKASSISHLMLMYDRLRIDILPGTSIRVERTREVRDPVVLLALLLKGLSSHHIETTLLSLKYTAIEAKQVAFLRKFCDFLPTSSAHSYYKSFVSSRLSYQQLKTIADFELVEKAKFAAFVSYRPAIKAEDLMKEGLKGKELGLELERREDLRFQQLYVTLSQQPRTAVEEQDQNASSVGEDSVWDDLQQYGR